MENASKALIMAAGVLLGIMILALGSYLFVTFSNYSKETEKELFSSEIAEFNNNFLKYQDKPEITTQDVVTIINFARNQKYWVKVIVNGTNYVQNDPNDENANQSEAKIREKLLKEGVAYADPGDNTGSFVRWKIKDIGTDSNTGRVNKITIIN